MFTCIKKNEISSPGDDAMVQTHRGCQAYLAWPGASKAASVGPVLRRYQRHGGGARRLPGSRSGPVPRASYACAAGPPYAYGQIHLQPAQAHLQKLRSCPWPYCWCTLRVAEQPQILKKKKQLALNSLISKTSFFHPLQTWQIYGYRKNEFP